MDACFRRHDGVTASILARRAREHAGYTSSMLPTST
jgi:hypothetical protein